MGQLYNPAGLAVDAAGNLYIADTGNHRILLLTPGGAISTVAGTGAAGFSGDGGPAVAAQLNAPSAVAVDANENIYIADTGNNRVRLVAPAGNISTIAGTGDAAYNGDNGAALQMSLCQSRRTGGGWPGQRVGGGYRQQSRTAASGYRRSG